ncbi:MAG: response regulator, partial [Anaerolineales bacterium]|nr:response regulator [Anaerolineales bacterium]
MPDMLQHVKKILVVEDQEQFSAPIRRWLEDEGYHVTLANNYEDAYNAIHSQHFHLAIVDISLVHDDPTDEGGLNLLREIESMELNQIMPCIVLTANVNVNNLLEATQERKVAGYIQKSPGYRTKLLTAVRQLFDDNIRINFDLAYDVRSVELVKDVADDVNWSMSGKPMLGILTEQVRDLFGKLFVDAKRVHIAKLKPGLTGAAVIRVQPTWTHGLGPPYVAKIGREDKVSTEAERYETYVRRYLPPNTIAQVKDVAYSRNVGALLYTFAENDMVPLNEFDEFYQKSSPDVIANSLRNLFETTCRYWYDARERKISDLIDTYYNAFQLDEEKLIQRIQVVLPHFDPDAERFRFEHVPIEAINPVTWLRRHQHEFVLPTYHCITHGDLTGRNIMVDQTNKCWLIDFYRTQHSHILRDFVILETDIKYRLMRTPPLEKFLRMEEGLLLTDKSGEETTVNLNVSRDIRKAMTVINILRSVAYEFVSGGFRAKYQESQREYLASLLMTTLNVARLRHIPEDRKYQAL